MFVYKKQRPQSIIVGSPIIRNKFLFILLFGFGGKPTLKAYAIGAPAAKS